MLMHPAEATNDARMLADVIQAAECRQAVALANVEGEDSTERAAN